MLDLGPNNDIVDIKESDNGNIWFSSQGSGLIEYQYDKKVFINHSLEYNLPTYISSIFPEEDEI